MLLQKCFYYNCPQPKLGEGNVFTHVCLFVGGSTISPLGPDPTLEPDPPGTNQRPPEPQKRAGTHPTDMLSVFILRSAEYH